MSKSDVIPSSMGHKQSDCAAIFSGGLDSTVLVYHLLQEGMTPHLISFNYGQRHAKELAFAQRTAHKLRLRHDIVDLTGITHLISNSALTSYVDRPTSVESSDAYIEVPEGHYAEDNMKKTVVPNRNMIMLSVAAGVAVNNSYERLATGVHAGDHFVYPDCRPMFISMVSATIQLGNEGFGPFDEYDPSKPFIYAPFVEASKEDIAYKALQLKVPFEETWSCYKGGDIHCGKCGTCVERLEAIDGATLRMNNAHGIGKTDEHFVTFDRTTYEDSTYWKEAVKNAQHSKTA